MRVLLASDSFDPAVGGVQRVVRDLADGLVAAGHAVHVLAPGTPGLADDEVLGGVPVARVRLGRPALRARAVLGFARRLPAARRRVTELLETFRPELVHLHFLQSPLAHLLPSACAARGVPLVATAHGRDVGDMVADDALGRRAVRAVLAAAAAVTAPSAATLAQARELAGSAGAALWRPVPNALPADARAWLDAPPARGGAGVVAVGELHRKKGFDVLLRALAELPGVPLRIGGEGAQRGELEALAAELGIAERVTFGGFVPRLALHAFLAGAAVQAVPSRREPFGLVLLEGMAAGLPVVASRTEGIPEVVGDSGAALLVPPDDPAALAAALRSVLGDAALAARLAAAGRARAAEHTSERTTAAYLAVYDAAMSHESRP